MKLTNPFALLGLGIVAIVAVIAVVESTKQPTLEKTVVVETAGEQTSKVVVNAGGDRKQLLAALALLTERDNRWKDSVDLGARTARVQLPSVV